MLKVMLITEPGKITLTRWRCIQPHWVPQKPPSFPTTQGLVAGGNLSIRFVQAAEHSVESLFPGTLVISMLPTVSRQSLEGCCLNSPVPLLTRQISNKQS